VPSCDAHNSHKSKDDQYLWQIVTATRQLNECGERMVRTKGLRTIARRPAMMRSLMQTAVPAYVYDFSARSWQPTAMVQFELPRVFTALEHLARALYLWHFHEKWPGRVTVFPSFAGFPPHEKAADREFRQQWRGIIQKAAAAMAGLPRFGENQDAFYYQVMPPDGASGVVMLATFYGSATVTCGFVAGQPE
jgi:hypothetical protein